MVSMLDMPRHAPFVNIATDCRFLSQPPLLQNQFRPLRVNRGICPWSDLLERRELFIYLRSCLLSFLVLWIDLSLLHDQVVHRAFSRLLTTASHLSQLSLPRRLKSLYIAVSNTYAFVVSCRMLFIVYT